MNATMIIYGALCAIIGHEIMDWVRRKRRSKILNQIQKDCKKIQKELEENKER